MTTGDLISTLYDWALSLPGLDSDDRAAIAGDMCRLYLDGARWGQA